MDRHTKWLALSAKTFEKNTAFEVRTEVLKSGTLDNRNFTLVRLVRQNAEDLLKLVNEILNLNKLEAGKLELHEEPVVVYNLIRRLVANFESHAQQQNIRFNFNYQPDKYLQLALDTHKIEKIINNLLSNALKFTPKEGIITVSVTDLQNQLLITVNDTGRGIPPVDLPQVFNRFYQSPQSDATSNMGSGIGLSLALELAKLMNGSLTVESTFGKGSKFSFSFPKKEILGTVASKEAIEMNDELGMGN